MANRSQKKQHDLIYSFLAERDGEQCFNPDCRKKPPWTQLQVDHLDNDFIDVGDASLCKYCESYKKGSRRVAFAPKPNKPRSVGRLEGMMKKEQRKPYRELMGLVNLGLCNCCRFSNFTGSSCCDSELECEHPLEVINGYLNEEHPDNVWSGDDCWGFRPSYDLQTAGVVVGILLEGNTPHKSQRYGEYIAIIPSKRDREYMLA